MFSRRPPLELLTVVIDADLIEEHLGPARDALGLSHYDLMALGRVEPSNQQEEFCMTVLALKMSHRANAARHTD